MFNAREFQTRAQIDVEMLDAWIEQGWLTPKIDNGLTTFFSEADLAKAQLISDLVDGIGVNEEGITIILNLLDQIHGLRFALHELIVTIEAQPKDVQHQILAKAHNDMPLRSVVDEA